MSQIVCAECGRTRPNKGRGLCVGCYDRNHDAGTLDRYAARPRIDNDARAEDLEWMAATGESTAGAAKRLGITSVALERWCCRVGRYDLWTKLREHDPHMPMDYQAAALKRWQNAS